MHPDWLLNAKANLDLARQAYLAGDPIEKRLGYLSAAISSLIELYEEKEEENG